MIKIILVDDHSIFRDGVKLWIENEGMGEVIAEASNGAEFIHTLQTLTPDLVIMDISMPVMDGIEATKKAVTLQPGIKILGITMHNDRNKYNDMILAGAKGFILKTSGKFEFEKAIQTVLSGNVFITNNIDL